MRVTHNSIAANVLANLQGNVSRLGETQQRLSSGKLISKPSDSPANRQYARNADDGLGWLNAADSALQDASEQVTRARGLVLQGLSTGTNGPEARKALALEIRQISEAMRDTANRSYLDRPVFGGTTKEGTAYPTGTTFNGDGEEILRTVGAILRWR
jgi:flagellar hook-associated protein 3 FlgL